MLIACISLYLLLNIAVGVWAARRIKTSQDFVLAGRGLSLTLATSVTFATWFGSESIMGAPAKFVEEAPKGGILSIIEEPFGSACFWWARFLPARFTKKMSPPSPIISASGSADRRSC